MSAAPVCGLIPELYNREDRWVGTARRQALHCSVLCLWLGCDGCSSSALSSSKTGCSLEHKPSKPFLALAAFCWGASSQPQKGKQSTSYPPAPRCIPPTVHSSPSLPAVHLAKLSSTHLFNPALRPSCICPSLHLAIHSFIYPSFSFIHTFSFL